MHIGILRMIKQNRLLTPNELTSRHGEQSKKRGKVYVYQYIMIHLYGMRLCGMSYYNNNNNRRLVTLAVCHISIYLMSCLRYAP